MKSFALSQALGFLSLVGLAVAAPAPAPASSSDTELAVSAQQSEYVMCSPTGPGFCNFGIQTSWNPEAYYRYDMVLYDSWCNVIGGAVRNAGYFHHSLTSQLPYTVEVVVNGHHPGLQPAGHFDYAGRRTGLSGHCFNCGYMNHGTCCQTAFQCVF